MTNEKLTATTQPKTTSLATDIAAHCLAFEQSPDYSAMLQKHVANLYENTIKETLDWATSLEQSRKRWNPLYRPIFPIWSICRATTSLWLRRWKKVGRSMPLGNN
ncbi:hypothetical protein YEEN111655_13320 [Yersinia entomophaga]